MSAEIRPTLNFDREEPAHDRPSASHRIPTAADAFRHPPIRCGPGDHVITEVLREIMVPAAHLTEAKHRRDITCELAMRHAAARGYWYSGSIAHGTHNAPLGDADCGVMIDRRFKEFRDYGPDAGPGGGKGPEGHRRESPTHLTPPRSQRHG